MCLAEGSTCIPGGKALSSFGGLTLVNFWEDKQDRQAWMFFDLHGWRKIDEITNAFEYLSVFVISM